MKIYVVETVYDYSAHLGFSTSRAIAQKKADKFNKQDKLHNYWVEEYTTDKNNWCDFDFE